MTDSDDKKRRGLRRGQQQQVNYCETTESSDNSRSSVNQKKVKRRGRPRKQRLSSDYSDGQLLFCHFIIKLYFITIHYFYIYPIVHLFFCLNKTFFAVSHSSRDSEEEDYEEEEENDHRRRGKWRRTDKEDLRSCKMGERRGKYSVGDRERWRSIKQKKLMRREKEKLRPVKRTDRKEESIEEMGRGRRREILSQQRRKRLAQMLKKRRPSTDEEDEEGSARSDESDESDFSSEEDRPIRKRLNRIDSDDEDMQEEGEEDAEDEEEEEDVEEEKDIEEVEGGRKRKNSLIVEMGTEGEAQEKGRDCSSSLSDRQRTLRETVKPGPGSPAVSRDSDQQDPQNGPFHSEDEEENEDAEDQTDSLNSIHNRQHS